MNEETMKRILDFYLLANDLKYPLPSERQSIADKIYGSIIIAIGINSEYHKSNNIGKTIRRIILGMINENQEDKLVPALNNLSNGEQYKKELGCFYVSLDDDGLAFDCEIIETALNYFFDFIIEKEKLEDLSIEELYMIARRYGFIGKIGYDDKKNYEIFKFYYLNRKLRDTKRTGWNETHWNIQNDRIENIAEHVVGTIALAMAIADEEIDLDKVCEVLAIHEIGEIRIGDISPYDGISEEEKEKIEHQAMLEVLGNLSSRESMYQDLLAFDEHSTQTFEFARYCDKIEADIQSRIYQDMGCHNPLTEQTNNVAFRSDKVKRIMEGDVKTPVDVWYEMDKDIYRGSDTFTKMLKYIKDNKIK